MTGFTYNGVHCEDLGLYYIPSKEELWFNDPDYDVYDTNIEWRDGGVYYTSKARVRSFALKCYFEEIDVAKRQAIKNWVRRDSSGLLVFDEFPFIYWRVHPSKIPTGNWYLDNNESHSGTVVLSFNAYEPFGYLTRKYNNGDTDGAENYCNLIDLANMPAEPTATDTAFEIYNPGTEACGLSMELEGSCDNAFRFFNEQNGTYCEFNSLPSGLRISVDGDTGYIGTYLAGTSMKDNGFAYHNSGVVRLEPNMQKAGIQFINGTVSGTEYQLDIVGYPVGKNIIGAEIVLDGGAVLKVESIGEMNNRVWCTASGQVTLPETGTCSIKTVNKIMVQEKSGASWVAPSTLNLSYIKTDYKPRAM